MEVKARHEMDPAYQWDFSHIFPTREAWEQAYAEAGEAVAAIAAVPGTLSTSPEVLKAGLETVYTAA